MRARRILAGLGIVVAVAIAAAAIFFERLAILAMDPGVPFDPNAAPRAPDYAR